MKHKVFATVFTFLVLLLVGVSLTNNNANTIMFFNLTTFMIPAILADLLMLNDQSWMIVVFGVAEFAIGSMIIGNILAEVIETKMDETPKAKIVKATRSVTTTAKAAKTKKRK